MANLLGILGCWAVSFLFSGMEAGILAVDPVRLRSRVKQNQRAARRLSRLLREPERLLITVLLVTNMADILALMIMARWLSLAYGYAGFFIALAIALPIYLFVLSVLPKSLFRRFPSRALAPLAGLLELLSLVLWPILEAGKQMNRLLLGDDEAARPRLFAAREELKQITTQSEREGSLTSSERAMIHNVFDFQNVRARNVMVPLEKAVTISPELSIERVLELSGQNQIDRFPVLSADGKLLGLLNVLDVLFDKQRRPNLAAYIRRVVTAREDEQADRLLLRLRAARLGLAAILDTTGSLIGIVTDELLVKHLVTTPVGSTIRKETEPAS